jgi:hypothetical protein
MSEFCSQSHAPLPDFGKKHTNDKSIRVLVIRPETEFTAFAQAMKASIVTLMVEQGPRQANDYGT